MARHYCSDAALGKPACLAPWRKRGCVYSVSSDTEAVSSASMEDLAEEADEPEAQVHDWRFSELRTTATQQLLVQAVLPWHSRALGPRCRAPFQYRDEGVVQYRQIQDAIRTMWHAAQASMKRHIGGSIPTGISKGGISEEELPQVCIRPRDAASNEDLKVAEGTKPVPKSQKDGPILSLQATAHDALTGKALGNNPSHPPDCMGGTNGLYYLNRSQASAGSLQGACCSWLRLPHWLTTMGALGWSAVLTCKSPVADHHGAHGRL